MTLNELYRSIRKDFLRKETLNTKKLSPNVMKEIFKNNWLRIWIPRKYNGLDISLKDGLLFLQKLAQVDGSLGWFVTLTSGANYFSRNINPDIAKNIFKKKNVCFGGSGLIGGTAEKIGDKYLINGYWRYATGAPFLSHFTFNAQIVENGKPFYNFDGSPLFLSFFVNKDDVKIFKTWKTIGLKATETHDFQIKKKLVSEKNSFQYNVAYSNDSVDIIPFNVFAYLTLAVNYIGIAEHFYEASLNLKKVYNQKELEKFLKRRTEQFYKLVDKILSELENSEKLNQSTIDKTRNFGRSLVEELSHKIIDVYQNLGVQASMEYEEINQVFRDFFTASQHNVYKIL